LNRFDKEAPMRKRIAGLVLALVLFAGAEHATAAQGICVECQWSYSGNRFICYYINWTGYSDCWASGGSCEEYYPICYAN
jgi:hypothetical protein